MEQEHKTKKLFKSIVLVVLFIGALVWYTAYYEKNNSEQNTANQAQNEIQSMSNCGLTVNYLKEINDRTFKIEAILDNNERDTLGCSWTSFEAQAGVVYVKDGQGNDVINPTPLTTAMENWMTDDPVLYTAQLEILNDYKGDALVIINEDDPSGEKISKTITFPITIK